MSTNEQPASGSNTPTGAYRPYVCEYQHEGSLWGITVQATSFEDAKARLRQMYYGRVLGTLEATIPACGGNWLATVICWLRNVMSAAPAKEPRQ